MTLWCHVEIRADIETKDKGYIYLRTLIDFLKNSAACYFQTSDREKNIIGDTCVCTCEIYLCLNFYKLIEKNLLNSFLQFIIFTYNLFECNCELHVSPAIKYIYRESNIFNKIIKKHSWIKSADDNIVLAFLIFPLCIWSRNISCEEKFLSRRSTWISQAITYTVVNSSLSCKCVVNIIHPPKTYLNYINL